MTAFFSLRQIREGAAAGHMAGAAHSHLAHFTTISDWVETYLLAGHTALGRPGPVCPFAARAVEADTVHMGVSLAGGADRAAIADAADAAARRLGGIAGGAERKFATVIVGFPNCADEAGIAALKKTRMGLKRHSLLHARMVALFYPQSADPGLWNPDFRPLRSPVPLLAFRYLVAQDAAFVERNPLLLPTFLSRFPLAGVKRLLAWRKRRGAGAQKAPLGK